MLKVKKKKKKKKKDPDRPTHPLKSDQWTIKQFIFFGLILVYSKVCAEYVRE